MEHKRFGMRNDGSVLGDDFYTKSLPTLTLGAIIWLFSTMFFGGYFGVPPVELSVGMTITLFITYIVGWIFVIILANRQKNQEAQVIFWVMAAITGLLDKFLLEAAADAIGLPLAKVLFIGAAIIGTVATVGGLAVGFLIRNKINYTWAWGIAIFGMMLLFSQWIFFLMFGFSTGYLIYNVIGLIWIFAVIVLDGATLPEKISYGFWMMAVIDIFLDFVIVVTRLFLIIVQIFANR